MAHQSSESGTQNLVFISYSHVDAKWLKRLRVHLKPLERHGVIVSWDDTKIKPGSQWREEIREALEHARVAVLLVSADFLASDFINTNELPPLLRAAETRGTLILPLILDHCRFEKTEGLSRFQAVNTPSKPLATLDRSRREAEFTKLSGIIEEALESSPKEPAAPPRDEPQPLGDGAKLPSRELAKRHKLRLRFWEQLLDLARKRGLPFHANRSPSTSNWIGGKAGIAGYRWNYVIWMDGAAVELDIDTGDKDKNKRLFDALRSRKPEIEAAYGAALEWQRLDDARRSAIRYIVREGGLTTQESEWPRIQTAMVEAMARLSEVLQPHLQLRAGTSLSYQPSGDSVGGQLKISSHESRGDLGAANDLTAANDAELIAAIDRFIAHRKLSTALKRVEELSKRSRIDQELIATLKLALVHLTEQEKAAFHHATTTSSETAWRTFLLQWPDGLLFDEASERYADLIRTRLSMGGNAGHMESAP